MQDFDFVQNLIKFVQISPKFHPKSFLGNTAAFLALKALPHKNASAIRYLEHILYLSSNKRYKMRLPTYKIKFNCFDLGKRSLPAKDGAILIPFIFC